MKVIDKSDQDVLFSVIIPAYNEEQYLPQTLSSLLESMKQVKELGEIIVVDNNSTDKTSDIAKDYGVRVVFEAKNQIARARNTGAKEAKGRYLIFLDADTTLSSNLLNQALFHLEKGDCCGGGAFLSFDQASRPLGRKIARLLNYLMRKCKLAAGCFIYCLREGFRESGGYNEHLYASEEIGFAIRLKSWGRKHQMAFKVISDWPVVTSSRKLERPFSLAISMIIGILFPFFVYFRGLCGFWYKR